jgi:hypothetical protein
MFNQDYPIYSNVYKHNQLPKQHLGTGISLATVLCVRTTEHDLHCLNYSGPKKQMGGGVIFNHQVRLLSGRLTPTQLRPHRAIALLMAFVTVKANDPLAKANTKAKASSGASGQIRRSQAEPDGPRSGSHRDPFKSTHMSHIS